MPRCFEPLRQRTRRSSGICKQDNRPPLGRGFGLDGGDLELGLRDRLPLHLVEILFERIPAGVLPVDMLGAKTQDFNNGPAVIVENRDIGEQRVAVVDLHVGVGPTVGRYSLYEQMNSAKSRRQI